MSRNLLLVVAGLLGLAAPAFSQDTLLRELYGQGVHAYFANDLRTAHSVLTSAIEQGSRDPRAFYFRGLTYSRLGRPDEATSDFRRGAEMEITGEKVGSIDRALERVQGRSRIAIEGYRRNAKLTAQLAAAKQKKDRYEEFARNEKKVLQNPPAAPAAGAALPPVAANPADDPFGNMGAEKPPAVAGGAAPPAAVPAADDPFGAPAATPPAASPPVAATDPADPFGDSNSVEKPAAAATPAGGAVMPSDTTNDPFADDPQQPAKPATPAPAEDPFGADPAMPAPAPGKPAPAPAPADDPFGDAGGAAPAKPAAPAPAPAANDDPFGDAGGAAPAPAPAPAPAKPAPKPADDDPFAN